MFERLEEMGINVVKFYLFVETLIYLLFMGFDLSGSGSVYVISGLKFSGILICFFYVCYISLRSNHLERREYRDCDSSYLSAALFFTVISDYFLLFTEQFVYGIAVFCIVQFIYLWRISLWKGDNREKTFFCRHLFLHVTITGFLLAIYVLVTGRLSLLESLAVFYFVSIADNLLQSCILCGSKRDKDLQSRRFFFLGLLLFFLCDCNVGIYNILQNIEITSIWLHGIYEFSAIGMWLFYLPAQILLTFSHR